MIERGEKLNTETFVSPDCCNYYITSFYIIHCIKELKAILMLLK